MRSRMMNVAMLAMLAVGCSSSHGLDGDAGSGEACGPVVCSPGTECCNASCGICVAPGEGCPAIACVDGGSPIVCGGTTCGAGEQCCPGCGPGELLCTTGGGPCPDIVCPPPPLDGGAPRACGGFPGAPCGPNEICDYPDGSYCGGDDSTGVCIPRPDSCPEPTCRPVCGCDGNTYCGDCEAHAAGTDVLREGACDADCDAMDAVGVGLCDGWFGYAWNGSDCAGISGCSCEGADCSALYSSYEACVDARSSCITDCRSTGCAAGQSCQLCWTDYACIPDGAVC